MIAAYQHGGKLTPEMIDLKLCEEIYHCTHTELDEQDAEKVDRDIVIITNREKVWSANRKTQATKRRRRNR